MRILRFLKRSQVSCLGYFRIYGSFCFKLLVRKLSLPLAQVWYNSGEFSKFVANPGYSIFQQLQLISHLLLLGVLLVIIGKFVAIKFTFFYGKLAHVNATETVN